MPGVTEAARALPGMPQAVLLVLGVAEGALASDGVGPRQRYVLLQQHGQDLIIIPMGSQDDRSHVHGGGVLRVLDPLHQLLKQNRRQSASTGKDDTAAGWEM